MGDPDAGEVLQNTVGDDIACFGNSPAVQFGDSGASPNVVDGRAFGECGFNVLSPDPNFGTGGSQPSRAKGPPFGTTRANESRGRSTTVRSSRVSLKDEVDCGDK